jgi:hypothetical protein
VSLTNPSDKPLHLRAVYGCCTLLGPATFVAPAGPGAAATFECFYAPLAQGQEEGVLRLVSKAVRVCVCVCVCVCFGGVKCHIFLAGRLQADGARKEPWLHVTTQARLCWHVGSLFWLDQSVYSSHMQQPSALHVCSSPISHPVWLFTACSLPPGW